MVDRYIERILMGIIVVVMVGVAIHTPLTVWLGVQLPGFELVVKAWKEVLMGIGLALLVTTALRRGQAQSLLADRIMQLSLVYAGLHFVMIAVFQNGLQQAGAGLLIDLRFVLFFVLVYGFLTLYPNYRRLFLKAFAVSAAIVVGFGLLQITVLPKDILTHVGYSQETIYPYMTVDSNDDYIRINSTLRGPNPVGAYVVIVAALIMAVALRWKLGKRATWLLTGGSVAAGLLLGASHSRSAMIAVVAALLLTVLLSVSKKYKKHIAIVAIVSSVAFAGLLFGLRDTSFVANVVFHNDPDVGAAIDSNADHADSLVDGTERMIRQPFGAGVGSTGSASLTGDKPLIIENQYLFIAHEVGWIGLVIFVWLFVEILRRLLDHRKSALALGVFGSGIGLAIIGMLLPVWVDDTVSITWWGLAAIAVAGGVHGTRKSN